MAQETRVVNLRKEPYDVYIGRAGRGEDGYFGNPCVIGKECYVCGRVHTDGGSTLECFQAYFLVRLASDVHFYQAVERLRGQTLGCFCKPKPCHGDVIKQYLNGEIP